MAGTRGSTDQTRREGRMYMCVRQRIMEIPRDRDGTREAERDIQNKVGKE